MASLALFAVAALADGPPVSVATAQTRPIVEIVRVSGTITSPQSAVLSPSVGGLVQAINVDAGDRVRAGDVIVTAGQMKLHDGAEVQSAAGSAAVR